MKSLTPASVLVWKIAATEAGAGAHALIEPSHLVIGLLSLDKVRSSFVTAAGLLEQDAESVRMERSAIADVLAGLRVDAGVLRRSLREAVGCGSGTPPGAISRSPATRDVFARAEALAEPGQVNALHLLAAVAAQPDPPLLATLKARGIDAARLASRVNSFLGLGAANKATRLMDEQGQEPVAVPAVAAPEAAAPLAAPAAPGPEDAVEAPPPERPPISADPSAPTPTIDRFGRDLTALAGRGELPPVFGRRKELLAIVQTLARSSKANPLLVGDAGVGKTAIVEALAARASAGKDEVVLGGLRVVELQLGALLGGTQYRGELEERVTKILSEARVHPELLLFADEVHTLVGAGRVGEGGADLASLVKPALARGELRLIGATTPAEYRRHIETDAALARRFERVFVPEPDEHEALEILRGLKPRLEEHHGVCIGDDALTAAVELSIRFDPDRRLPDKAIDLLDRCGARARIPELSMKAGADGVPASGEPASPSVDARLVAEVLADARGIPVEVVQGACNRSQAAERARTLGAFLRERLIGQEAVVERVGRRVRLAHAAITRRPGPLSVLLLLGPSGVGKTELARLTAEHLFGERSALVRFDMSEYMEEHSVSRLLGAPPGYVGHEEPGLLVEALRARPYAVVLLDEVEKAHPRVFDVFLQVFDEGRITDTHGRTADARYALFVLTSNLGSAQAHEPPGFGWNGQAAEMLLEVQALAEARRFFRPELLNRIDELLVFRPLGPEDVTRILRRMFDELQSTVLEQHGVRLSFAAEAEAFVARQGSSPEQGVRELRRCVERLVEAPLSSLVLAGKLQRAAAWRLVHDDGGLYWLPEEG